jgi:hypothetical protein
MQVVAAAPTADWWQGAAKILKAAIRVLFPLFYTSYAVAA